jgi:hypothetical protein
MRESESREAPAPSEERRAMLKKLGRFAVVTASAVTMLLAAGTKPAKAAVISEVN